MPAFNVTVKIGDQETSLRIGNQADEFAAARVAGAVFENCTVVSCKLETSFETAPSILLDAVGVDAAHREAKREAARIQ